MKYNLTVSFDSKESNLAVVLARPDPHGPAFSILRPPWELVKECIWIDKMEIQDGKEAFMEPYYESIFMHAAYCEVIESD
jgi:hypothetical protein